MTITSLSSDLLSRVTEDYTVRVVPVDDPAKNGQQVLSYGIFNRTTDVREGVVSSLAMAVAYAHSLQAGLVELRKNLDNGVLLDGPSVPRVPNLN